MYIREHLNNKLKHGRVVLFSDNKNKKPAAETQKMRKLLEEFSVDFEEVDVHHAGQELTVALQLHTGYAELPNIYFGNEHVGGLDDLKSYLSSNADIKRLIDENGISSSVTETEEEEIDILFERLEK